MSPFNVPQFGGTQGKTMAQSLKLYLQMLLRRLGLYHRLKASLLYSLYWSVADRSLVEDARRELDFYRNLLGGFQHGDLIFDIGANQGVKTQVFLRLGARVVAVDPDEVNRDILEAKFRRYRLIPQPVVIVNQAVSDKNTTETMWIDEPGSAKNTLNRKWVDILRVDERFGHALDFEQRREITTTTLEQLFTNHGVPFFIKIDVEGYEVSVLRGLRRPVPYLSFEVNLPEFRPEGLQCVALLGGVAADGKFNYTTDCRRGLMLQEWLGPLEFSQVLAECGEESIEVFWKSNR
jgi:FkbM family methyltransferase